MRIEVNGTRLWFDVEGGSLVPDGAEMRARPTIVLLHGGPASYDHSYFKPWFAALTDAMQVVYLDLRDHGRSDRGDPEAWTFEQCADDVRAFCDALGIERPIVLGHSAGGMVAIAYGARHPGHAGGIVLSSTKARFDLGRLTEAFRRAGGDEVARLARRSFGGHEVTPEEWATVFVAFGPNRPAPDALARRIRNADLAGPGLERLREVQMIDLLGAITSPTLVCVGELDAATPVDASVEIMDGLAPGVGRLEILEGAGHFPWLDVPDRYFGVVRAFVSEVSSGVPAAPR